MERGEVPGVDRESWIAGCVSELGGFAASSGTLSEDDATDEFNRTIADVYMVACDPAYQDWDLGPLFAGVYACYGTQTNLDGETRIVFAFVYADADGRTIVDERDPITAEEALGLPGETTEVAAVDEIVVETMAVVETTEVAAVDEIVVETMAAIETTDMEQIGVRAHARSD